MFLFLLTSNLLQPYLLETDPIGWDGISYSLSRDSGYHGLQFQVSLDLTFVKRGADYIRKVYEQQGPEGVIRLTIFERNPNDYRPEEIESGRLDLTKYKESDQGVTVSIKETGFAEKIQNLDTIPVDVLKEVSQGGSGMAPISLQQVELYSQPIVKRSESIRTAFQPAASIIITSADKSQEQGYFYAGYNFSSSSAINELGVFQQTTNIDAISATPAEFFIAPDDGDYEVTVDASLQLEPRRFDLQGDFDNFDAWYYLRVNEGSQPNYSLTTLDSDRGAGGFTLTSAPIVRQLTLKKNDRVFLFGRYAFGNINNNVLNRYQFELRLRLVPGAKVKVRALTRAVQTTTGGLLIYEAFQRVIQSITDTPLSFYSEYFGRTDTVPAYAEDGPGSMTLVTDSWRLRGFPTSERPFILKLEELYQSQDAQHCLGLGIEVVNGRQVIRIEPRAYFYQQGQTALTLERVSELVKEAAAEFLYNLVEVGYQDWKSGSENGLAEFNSRRTYTLPTQQKATYSAISPYSASGYKIEETRRDRYEITATKENNGDGQVFLIALQRTNTGYTPAKNEGFTLVEGVLAPNSTYNLRFSPSRMLDKHLAWLHTGLLYQDGRALILSSFEANVQVRTQQTAEAAPVVESANIPVADLPPALFYPETYTATARVRPAQLRQMRRTPYGVVTFLDRQNIRRSGFMRNPEIEPSTRRFTLNLFRAS